MVVMWRLVSDMMAEARLGSGPTQARPWAMGGALVVGLRMTAPGNGSITIVESPAKLLTLSAPMIERAESQIFRYVQRIRLPFENPECEGYDTPVGSQVKTECPVTPAESRFQADYKRLITDGDDATQTSRLLPDTR